MCIVCGRDIGAPAAVRGSINTHPSRRDQEIKVSLPMTFNKIPERSKAIVLRKAGDQSGLYEFDAVLEDRDVPPLKDGQVLVRIEAAGFNHREVSLRCVSICVTVVNLPRFGSAKVFTRVLPSGVSTARTEQAR